MTDEHGRRRPRSGRVAGRRPATLTTAEIEIVIAVVDGRRPTAADREQAGAEPGRLPPETVQALLAGRPVTFDDPRLRAVYELATALVRSWRPADRAAPPGPGSRDDNGHADCGRPAVG